MNMNRLLILITNVNQSNVHNISAYELAGVGLFQLLTTADLSCSLIVRINDLVRHELVCNISNRHHMSIGGSIRLLPQRLETIFFFFVFC